MNQVESVPLVRRQRKPRSPNRARCPGCQQFIPLHTADCAMIRPAPLVIGEEQRALREALCARLELVREIVVATRAALLQAEAQIDEIESRLTP